MGGKLKLKSGQSLNHEANATLLLNVTATESGSPGLTVSKAVIVNVNDVNEFDPVIQSGSLSIDESSPSGSPVGNVVASDQDTSQSLSYAITSGNTGNIFAIDGSGRITVAPNAALNHEQTSSYTLTVAATDAGSPARSTNKTFNVTINDVNEAPTQLTIDSRVVSENLAGVVGTITIIDEDISDTHKFATSLDLAASDPLAATIETRVDRQVAETSLEESFASGTNDDFFRIVGEREQTIRARIRGSSAEEVDLSEILDTLARDLAPRWC